ncbi:hydantoinase B/oxoprolinase family protein [Roseomonas sp. E05]|uniref:hydantoinase B/oxoprolinase family protein n=1 Tax=Roseomonas sp. E05 TaxID=3046310 RepID=UPI0024B9A373|nr:hydantoinase B/oxoprolinase family protein [Roseomonas sp. E05]MDJ0390544.1 hydantoinase B/oxoprolinase family protein [Roseomonas sp. E05]
MDIVTYEILRNGLYATAREMKIAMMRTAGSPIVHSGGDASAALFDAEMQLVAQGNDIPTMLGSAVISTRASVEAVGRDKLRPGDVIISNDVYLGGGNHQPDIQFTRPVFVDNEIVAFVMTRGHWTDIGGQAPGSYTCMTWDVFAEGVRIPPVLLYREDKPVEDVMTLIVQNTRDPAVRLLDIQAQYAGCYVGDRRVVEMVRKYGKEALRETMARALDHSERLMREAIRAIPDGIYEAEDALEPVAGPAGWPTEPIPLKVKITKQGDRIDFDYAGTGAQTRGGINCPFSVTCNSTWFTVKAITDVTIPINQGCYRPVGIAAPEGSVVNCRFPAPVVAGNTETSPRIIDLLLKALAPAVPKRVVGQSNCGAFSGIFGGDDPDEERVRRTGRKFVGMIDPHAGGMGARADKDGVNGIRVYVGNAGSTAVEIIEQTSPLLVEEWSLVPDTGGAGEFRGGLTSRRVYRVGYEEATFTACGERGIHPPLGQFGGGAGSTFLCDIQHSDGSEQRVPAKAGHSIVHRGDRVRLQPAGSGGYGDPRRRPRQKLLDDLRDGYITAAALTRDYFLSEAEAAALLAEAGQPERAHG